MTEYDGEDVPDNIPPDPRMSESEVRLAAEVSALLEDDLGIDTRRLFIRFKQGLLYIQGSVESAEIIQEAKELLAQRSFIKELDLRLTVNLMNEDF